MLNLLCLILQGEVTLVFIVGVSENIVANRIVFPTHVGVDVGR